MHHTAITDQHVLGRLIDDGVMDTGLCQRCVDVHAAVVVAEPTLLLDQISQGLLDGVESDVFADIWKQPNARLVIADRDLWQQR